MFPLLRAKHQQRLAPTCQPQKGTQPINHLWQSNRKSLCTSRDPLTSSHLSPGTCSLRDSSPSGPTLKRLLSFPPDLLHLVLGTATVCTGCSDFLIQGIICQQDYCGFRPIYTVSCLRGTIWLQEKLFYFTWTDSKQKHIPDFMGGLFSPPPQTAQVVLLLGLMLFQLFDKNSLMHSSWSSMLDCHGC